MCILVSWAVYSIFCALHHAFHPKIQHYIVHTMSHCSRQQTGLKPHITAWAGKWQEKRWMQTTFPRDEGRAAQPQEKPELVHSCHSSLGTSAQGTVASTQGGTRSPPAPISSTALIPISVSQDQEHRVTPIPCPQSSRSLLLPIEKTILSFIFDPKLFSCG